MDRAVVEVVPRGCGRQSARTHARREGREARDLDEKILRASRPSPADCIFDAGADRPTDAGIRLGNSSCNWLFDVLGETVNPCPGGTTGHVEEPLVRSPPEPATQSGDPALVRPPKGGYAEGEPNGGSAQVESLTGIVDACPIGLDADHG